MTSNAHVGSGYRTRPWHINLSIIALLSNLSIIEHDSKIFGHNDSTNVQNLLILKFNIVLKYRLLRLSKINCSFWPCGRSRDKVNG